MNDTRNAAAPVVPGTPWWRHGMMWLVVGGPAVVVVAAIVTAVIAIKGADTLVDDGGSRSGADAPAVKARNHAATPPAGN